jgi:hypothetical protein
VRYVKKPSRAYAINSFLIFLELLKGDAQRLSGSSDAIADVRIDASQALSLTCHAPPDQAMVNPPPR